MKDEEIAEEWWNNWAVKDWNDIKEGKRLFIQAFLAGLKAGRPQWHDLRKDPKDLPDEGSYLVVWQNARGYREIMQMNYEEDDDEKLHWIDGDQDCWDNDVIAWCEIPTFDKE